MADERRTHQRVPVLLDIVWEGTTGKYEARTSDISLGGCFIDTIGQVILGEMIGFKLRLPGGGWIELQGEVSTVFPNVGFGVRFTQASDWKKLEWLIKAESYRAEKPR